MTIIHQLTKAIDILLEANLFEPSVLENAQREYRDLMSEEPVISKVKAYTREVRLDDFWMSVLNNTKTPNLIQIEKCLLILSHGNASLEKGFSVNRDVLVDNLTEDSLRGQSLIYDAVQDAGGIFKVDV